jgi:hypothetical protein
LFASAQDVGELALVIVGAALALYYVGLTVVSFALVGSAGAAGLVSAVVTPLVFARRAARVLRQVDDKFDRDGYRVYENKHGRGRHYRRAQSKERVYPLDSFAWGRKRSRLTGEPLWCVTGYRDTDEYWFCDRSGERLPELPAALREQDPRAAFRRLDDDARYTA